MGFFCFIKTNDSKNSILNVGLPIVIYYILINLSFSYPLKGPYLAKMAKNGYFCIINTNDSRNFKSCLFDSRYKTYYCDLSTFNRFDCFLSLKRPLLANLSKDGYFCVIETNDSRNLKCCSFDSKYRTYYCNLSKITRFDPV